MYNRKTNTEEKLYTDKLQQRLKILQYFREDA